MRVAKSSGQPADLNATWTYNNEGNLTGLSYPGDPNAAAYPAATYSYFVMALTR